MNAVKLEHCKGLVELGQLPRSSRFNWKMSVAPNMVVVTVTATLDSPVAPISAAARLTDKIAIMMADVCERPGELWFDLDGNAYLSFELESDAVMFQLCKSSA